MLDEPLPKCNNLTMTLAEAVSKLRQPILNNAQPDCEMLKIFVEMVELNYSEWAKMPNNDKDSQKWADFLKNRARQQGWVRKAIKAGVLPEVWLQWPPWAVTPVEAYRPERGAGKSVTMVSGGAFEQNRRKH